MVLSATFAALAATTTCAVFAQEPIGQYLDQLVDEAWQVINRAFVDPTYHHHDWQRTRREFLSKKYGSTKEAQCWWESSLPTPRLSPQWR